MNDAETRTLVIEREIAHPPEKIWRALTQPALITEWLMPNDFAPEIGHRFQFRLPPMPQWNGIVDCEVLECETGRRLVYSWNTEGEPVGLRTTVTFTLTPTARGAMLRMEQSGFGPGTEKNYRGAQYGWTQFLEKLEKVAAGA